MGREILEARLTLPREGRDTLARDVFKGSILQRGIMPGVLRSNSCSFSSSKDYTHLARRNSFDLRFSSISSVSLNSDSQCSVLEELSKIDFQRKKTMWTTVYVSRKKVNLKKIRIEHWYLISASRAEISGNRSIRVWIDVQRGQ